MKRALIGLLLAAGCGCPEIEPTGVLIEDGTYRQRPRSEGLEQALLDDDASVVIEDERVVVEYTNEGGARVRVTYRIVERHEP